MSGISTHILDLASGRPASGVRAILERRSPEGWVPAGSGETDADGRIGDFDESPIQGGNYRLTFDTGEYFARIGVAGFYPEVSIVFRVRDPDEHHHVPLLVSPNGFTTYRGS